MSNPKTSKKRKKPPIKESELEGFRDLRAMRGLLERLSDVGCERDKAGNRKLLMNDYCLLVLMWLYNPVIDSLRGLQQTTDLPGMRKRLGVGRASLGSLSESVAVFDPEPLAELAEELRTRLRGQEPFSAGKPINPKVISLDFYESLF